MVTIGEVIEIPREFIVEWKIKDFLSLSPEVDKSYCSPLFSFANESWYLTIFPNGATNIKLMNGRMVNTNGYIDLHLSRKSSGPSINVNYSLGLKALDKRIEQKRHCTHIFEKNQRHGVRTLFNRFKLLERKIELMPSGVLQVVCKLKYLTSTKTEKKCSYCKTTLEAGEDISSHQKKCMNKPIKCPDCGDVIVLKDWYDHDCHFATVEGLEKLSHDLNTLLLSGNHSDTIIKVKGVEFQLHRNILTSRNLYFDAMFKNDMKEKSSGIVSIDDCEPDTFRSFIHFLYTGKVNKLTSGNVCNLYEVADMYQEDQLKNECLQFMLNSISVDNFCDSISLALKYSEKELLQNAIALFTSKGNEIALSLKWQAFVSDYPTEANELFIKSLNHYIK